MRVAFLGPLRCPLAGLGGEARDQTYRVLVARRARPRPTGDYAGGRAGAEPVRAVERAWVEVERKRTKYRRNRASWVSPPPITHQPSQGLKRTLETTQYLILARWS